MIAFSDYSIHLIDMSYEYTVRPTVYKGHTDAICDIQLFESGDQFLSLDASGTIKVWSLKETEINRRRNSRQEDSNIGVRQGITSPKASETPVDYLQSIENSRQNPIKSILLQNDAMDTDLRLLAATTDGSILTYDWQVGRKKFELRRSHSFKSKLRNIVKMFIVQKNTLMIVNDEGITNFYNLIDQSILPRTQVFFPRETPLNIYEMAPLHDGGRSRTMSDQHTIAVIFPSGIFQLRIGRNRTRSDDHTIEHNGRFYVEHLNDYQLSAEQNSITCCAATHDRRYLLLGTKKGIIVLEPETNREILRSSISDSLTSIDVCSVENLDSGCKYMLISATKKGQSVVYVHGILLKDNLMQWATNKIAHGSTMNRGDSMVSWFNGSDAFDICEMANGDFQLVGVDLKNLIHTKTSVDNFVQTISMDQIEPASVSVSKVSIGANRKFVSCENGIVYEIGAKLVEIMRFDAGPVDYLKYFEEFDFLIASTNAQYRVCTPRKSFAVNSRKIQNAFTFGQLIVIVKIDGTFEVRVYLILTFFCLAELFYFNLPFIFYFTVCGHVIKCADSM